MSCISICNKLGPEECLSDLSLANIHEIKTRRSKITRLGSLVACCMQTVILDNNYSIICDIINNVHLFYYDIPG